MKDYCVKPSLKQSDTHKQIMWITPKERIGVKRVLEKHKNILNLNEFK